MKYCFRILSTLLIALSQTVPVLAQPSEWQQHVDAAEDAYSDGKYPRAINFLKQAVDQSSSADERALAVQNLAFLNYLAGNMPSAEELYLKALPETEQAWGVDSMEYAENLQGLSRALRRQSKFAEADPVLRKVLEIRRKNLGGDHRFVGRTLLDIAVNYDRQGKYTEAELAWSQSLLVREKQFGKNAKSLIPYLQTYSDFLLRTKTNLENKPLVDARIESLNTAGEADVPQEDTTNANDQPRFLRKSPSASQ